MNFQNSFEAITKEQLDSLTAKHGRSIVTRTWNVLSADRLHVNEGFPAKDLLPETLQYLSDRALLKIKNLGKASIPVIDDLLALTGRWRNISRSE